MNKKIQTAKISEIENVQNYIDNHGGIEQAYMGQMSYYSLSLDLISLYLKGQKLLYTESKTYCELLLYSLMLPAIFISSACTVLSVPLKSVTYGSLVLSILNGFNSFLLAVVSYMKLDAKAQAHKSSSYQFDKLQALCDFYSGKIQMFPSKQLEPQLNEYIEEIQKKVAEIKDSNQFVVPEVIRYRYNNIYSYNIFAMMKKHKTNRTLLIQKLLDITNVIKEREKKAQPELTNTICQSCEQVIVDLFEIRSFAIDYKQQEKKKRLFPFFNKETEVKQMQIDIYDKNIPLTRLYNQRDQYIKDIIEHRNMTIEMSEDYNSEAEKYIKEHRENCYCFFDWLKT